MEIDPVHAKFGNLIDHMITEPEKVDYFKLTCAGEQMTEGDFKKAEEMDTEACCCLCSLFCLIRCRYHTVSYKQYQKIRRTRNDGRC